MRNNVGYLDRTLRAFFGLALLMLLLTEPFGALWYAGWIGVILLVTAVVGYCPLYRLFGITTCPFR